MLSILLVCYNQESYIKQALDSVLMQNMPFEYEFLVADDSSNDGTLDIIKSTLLGNVKSLRILDNSKNLGISKNYQRGFNECKGQYIAVIEGDDYWTDPNRLVKHISFLESHRECVMTMNRFIVYEEELNEFSFREWNSSDEYCYVTMREMILENKLGNLSACVFRKSEIDKISQKLYELDMADWMLGMVLSQNGFIAILKEMMSVYRVHCKGEWSKHKHDPKRRESVLAQAEKYNEYFEYKYDKEFNLFKLRMNNSIIGQIRFFKIRDFFPPFVIYLEQLIFPKAVRYIMRCLYAKMRNELNSS